MCIKEHVKSYLYTKLIVNKLQKGAICTGSLFLSYFALLHSFIIPGNAATISSAKNSVLFLSCFMLGRRAVHAALRCGLCNPY